MCVIIIVAYLFHRGCGVLGVASACVYVHGCVDACVRAWVRTYVCVHGSGCATRGCGVRACVYAQIEGMDLFYFILFFDWFLWSGENREKRKGTYVAWTDDGAVPAGHEDIIAILEAIRARSIADALFAFFEFF
jgi:hypothetical protein